MHEISEIVHATWLSMCIRLRILGCCFVLVGKNRLHSMLLMPVDVWMVCNVRAFLTSGGLRKNAKKKQIYA